MTIISRLKNINKKIDAFWSKALIFLWVIILLGFAGNGFRLFPEHPPIEEQLKQINEMKHRFSYKNCDVSQENEIRDFSPLKTNTSKGTIDLIEDTQSGGVKKNEIPAINNPKYSKSDDLKNCIGSDSKVYVIDYKNTVKIFPSSILINHQVINDNHWQGETEDDGVVITYSPFSDSATAFVSGDKIFGVSGRLYYGNTLIFDDATESLWSSTEGNAIIGDLTGSVLKQIPVYTVAFSDAVGTYPEAQILSFDTGFILDYDKNLYRDFQDSEQMMGNFPNYTWDISPHEKIVFINIDGTVKGYLETILLENDLIDEVSGKKIKIITTQETGSVKAFENSDSEKENEIPITSIYYYSWRGIYPEAQLYLGEN